MPVPTVEEIQWTEREVRTEQVAKRPIVPAAAVETEPFISNDQCQPEQKSFDYDLNADPTYTKKFHKLNSQSIDGDRNRSKVQQSLYDEESKEVPSAMKMRYNDVVNTDEKALELETED